MKKDKINQIKKTYFDVLLVIEMMNTLESSSLSILARQLPMILVGILILIVVILQSVSMSYLMN